jgi:hypothetical protein
LFLIFLKEDEKNIVAHCQNTYAHARVAAKTGIDHTYRLKESEKVLASSVGAL